MRSLDDILPATRPSTARRALENAAIGMLPLLVGGVSGLATLDGLRGWYRTLDQPSWNPPDRLFGPVWTGLYALMGGSLVQVVRATEPSIGPARRVALALFAGQLALNGAWSWIFFSRHAVGAALAEILVLWLAIVATIASFAAIRPSAAALLVPYLAWVTFATALTAEIWRRNR
ncbi:MAG TPA: TspO/MBR family protein [Candidatus Limnocylindrales bacterium]|nr:TspO/MBR family protein [Candidatus Limnocylindrales bacterium]